jgi:two-component sensor histidine kinase/uncharacterized protein HemY
MRYIFLLLFISSTLTSIAQADSLKKLLSSSKGKDRLRILHLLIQEDKTEGAFSAYLEEGLSIAKASGDVKSEAALLCAAGDRLMSEGKNKKAIGYFTEAYTLSGKQGLRPEEIEALNKAAYAYESDLDYKNAEQLYEQALQKSRDIKDLKATAATLQNLGIFYIDRRDYNKALECFTEELAADKELQDSVVIASCYNNIGLVFYYRSYYNQSISFYEKNLHIKRAMHDDAGAAQALLNIGISYREQGEYDKALENLLEAARVFEKRAMMMELSSCYNSIGNILLELGSTEKALSYHLMALDIREKLGYKRGIAGSLTNLGNVYKKKGEYGKALEYLDRSLEVKNEIGDKKLQASSHDHLGEVYYLLNNASKAEYHYNLSLDLKRQVEDPKGMAITLNNMGTLYISIKEYSKALQHLDSARSIAEHTGAKDVLVENYEHTAKAYKLSGNSDSAYHYYEKRLALKDSILNEQKNTALAEMQVKYETERKEQEILLLNEKARSDAAAAEKQNTIIYSLAGGSVLLLIIVFLSYKASQASKKASRQKEIMMKELHHRVKNNMQVLSSLLSLQKERMQDSATRDALTDVDHRLQAMMLIHQDLYGDNRIAEVNMQEYISKLVDSLLFSFGYPEEKIKIRIAAPGIAVDPDKALSLGFIINEVVSNALKHAFHDITRPELFIGLETNKENTLRLIISDNGKGLSKNINTLEASSFGLRMVKMFLDDLQGSFSINTDKGTRFDFHIPR